MPVRTLTPPVRAAGSAANPLTGTSGSWVWGPLTIEWSFQFAPEFFDADVKLFGTKVATFDLSEDEPIAKLDVSAFNWTVDGTITLDVGKEEVIADLNIKQESTVVFDRKFVLFSWAPR